MEAETRAAEAAVAKVESQPNDASTVAAAETNSSRRHVSGSNRGRSNGSRSNGSRGTKAVAVWTVAKNSNNTSIMAQLPHTCKLSYLTRVLKSHKFLLRFL